MPLKTMETPPFPRIDQAAPRRALSHAPRSPSWTAAPVPSLGTPRVAVWGGRGAVARLWGVRWTRESRCFTGHTKTE